MTNNPVGWFEIYVDDMDRAQTFYETVFGIELEKMDNPAMEMRTFPMWSDRTGAPGALVHMEGIAAGSNSTLVYFSCEDCAVEQGRIEASGGQIQRGKTPIGEYGFISLVFDTEGNRIGLHSRK
ncbi:MAG: VOC family protein [Gammaproteobacteria bacterium]|jgi:hypothetical protein|nr:VOC family protein [Gammaproteobacteria bacterium]